VGRGTPFVLAVALALLVSPACAQAQITASAITAPAANAELFYNGDAAAGSVTVRGTVSGTLVAATGQLVCYYAGDESFTRLASDIGVSAGSFALVVSLGPVRGQACRLALVPGDRVPRGAAAAAFQGPAISVSEQQSSATKGNEYNYYVLSGALTWSFALGSLGSSTLSCTTATPFGRCGCPVVDSFATDPITLGSFPLFAGSACLPQAAGTGARSALQIDGANAYPPASIPDLAAEPGFEALDYSAEFDPSHDTVTITDTEPLMVCDPPGGYPPAAAACPSLHDSGVQVQQTAALLPGGQVTRVSQRFASVDGKAHAIDALFAQSVQAPVAGAQPGFEFAGQTAFAPHGAPDAFAAFPPAPSSILVLASTTAPPAESNPIGAITFQRPPASASFTSPPGAQTATVAMHYADVVPAGGAVVYAWAFSQASSVAGLLPLERFERDRFSVPALTIATPRNRSHVTTPLVAVRGSASDPVGIASVAVDGRPVAITAGGAFSASVALHPGSNVISVSAANEAGNGAAAAVSVTYTPRCIVPRLRGKKLAAARTALRRARCRVGMVRSVRSRRVRRGRVISSKPRTGTMRRPGSTVGLLISLGR
jgi:hypothetical protein